ncbi:MAG: prepilin-type N-terminal cleavage/methylation domain-containing protein [Candidatus Omnitrophota bacterium]
MSRKNNGLTLVELLIVTAILFVISLGIYATFNNGVNIWQRLNGEVPQEDLYILFDKFGSDVRNCLRFKGIDFYGYEDEVGFAGIVDSAGLRGRTVGAISYFYDTQMSAAVRKEKDFSQVYADQGGAVREFSKNIKSLRFQYYSYDTVRKEYIWQDQWIKEGFPLAVCMEVEFTHGKEVLMFTKTVNIPVAG